MRPTVLLLVALALAPTVRADPTPPSLEAAAERARRHDDLAAIALLDAMPEADRSAAPARYLRARLLERTGQLASASSTLASFPVDELPDALRDDLVLRRARLFARSGRCDEARGELERRATLPDASALVRSLAGECALERGAAEDAVRFLALAASDADASVDRVTVLRTLAAALDRLGRRDEAAQRLREAFLADPAHPDALAIRAELRARAPALADLDDPTRESIVARLTDARAYDRALALLDERGEPSDRPKLARHLHQRGALLFAMRTRYREAADVLDRAARFASTDAIADELMAARAISRAGDDAAAIRRFDRIVERHPRAPQAREAAYAAALLELRDGSTHATRRMEVFLEAEGPRARGDRVGEGHYLLALHHLGAGSHQRARPYLERACRQRPDRLSREGCAYIGARLDVLAGRRSVAVAAYRALAADEPNAWYGLLARQRLAELGESPEPAAAPLPATEPPPLVLPPEVSFLVRLGLDEDAADRLRAAAAGLRGDGLSGLASLVAAHAAVGDAARAFRLAREGATRTASGDSALHAFFVAHTHPRPFADVVEPLAENLGVDAAYVYGTMRQESGFDPAAVSRVGAVGLLQLMPSTAARAAEHAGIELDPAMLFDPRVNVRVALVEMSELTRRYRGHLALVASGYNAGVAKTDQWLNARHGMPLDLFVEWIPFDETRGYVRRVVGHAARYHALSGHPEVGPTLLAPLPSPVPMNTR